MVQSPELLTSTETTTSDIASADTAGRFERILDEIADQYLADERVWVVGFSGGKDSTTLLQLVFYALRRLPPEKLTKEVHVLCNDTLVENPAVVRYIDDTLDKIRMGGERLGFPMKVAKVTPTLADSFWVNLIGKGYPSPNRFFRWCTERMKINPTSAYIKDQVSEHGEAIILLGTRKAESANRAHSMRQHERKGQRLRRHQLPGAFVYAPIADLSDNEIWMYLLQVENPWGSDNRKLFTLYRNASGGECPLVIDTSTPSCGNSRFGCWTCTVVDHDKSMEGLIESGEDWMEPMLRYRDWLREIRNDTTRREMLRKLLETQQETGLTLISEEELSAIQWVWHHDFYDTPVVAEVVREVTGEESSAVRNDIVERRKEERKLLEEICAEHDIPADLVEQLVQIEKDKSGLMRRHGLFQDIDMALRRYLKRTEVASH